MPPRNGKTKTRSRRRKPRSGGRPTNNTSLGKYTVNTVFKAATFSYGTKFKFISGSSTTFTITSAKLLDACGVLAATATSAYAVWAAVRLKSVEIQCAPYTSGAALSTANVKVNWNAAGGSISGPAEDVDAISLDPSAPTHIFTRPPQSDVYYAGQWNSYETTTQLCEITIPSFAVVTVIVDLVGADFGDTAAPTARVVAGKTVGGLYYGYLDSLTTGAATLSPIGRAVAS